MPEFLQDWVTAQARVRPQATAVVGETGRLTYAGLEDLSNRIAGALADAGCGRGDRVALLMPKSPEAIAALVGIYKTGGLYVPLDPHCPAARLAAIVRSCGSRLILAGGPVARLAGEIAAGARPGRPVPIGWIGAHPPDDAGFEPVFGPAEVAHRQPSASAARNEPDDPAHILFTSGSSGAPKGVVITHRSVIRFVEWAVGHFAIGPADRLSAHPPLHFDLSIFDIFGTFAAGASMYLVPQEINLQPQRIAAFIREHALTQWFSVPSVLTYMSHFGAVRAGDFPSLKRLLWCGEVFPTPVLIDWMRRLPHVRFTNLYGPTETTIASSSYTLPRRPDDPRAPIPIGTPCDGEALFVLDEALRPVPPGQTGELFIAGVGLSPGYWNDPERTRAAFLPRPGGPAGTSERIYRTGDRARLGEDGLVYLLGRTDSQIKSRGYRIELGDIESSLHSTGRVRECAVVALPTAGFEGTLIACAYVPAPGADPSPTSLRRELALRVPSYMLPARWKTFERLPVNGSGKIDRRALKELFQRDALEAARHA
jgi:amino acid adenylation domain-containing protein